MHVLRDERNKLLVIFSKVDCKYDVEYSFPGAYAYRAFSRDLVDGVLRRENLY